MVKPFNIIVGARVALRLWGPDLRQYHKILHTALQNIKFYISKRSKAVYANNLLDIAEGNINFKESCCSGDCDSIWKQGEIAHNTPNPGGLDV